MGFFTKIEQMAANKLKAIFLDIKQQSEDADSHVDSLEAQLQSARAKAADIAHNAHLAAIAAAEKAKAEAEALAEEVKVAESKALLRASKLVATAPSFIEPKLDGSTTTNTITQ